MKFPISILAWVILFGLSYPVMPASGQTVTVKFSIDMSLMISNNRFNPQTDRLFIRGTFNGWGEGSTLSRVSSTSVFTTTLSLQANSFYEYKFSISTSNADNGGYERTAGLGPNGNRTLTTGVNPLVLPVVFYNNEDLALNLTTDHFRFFCTTQDLSILNDFSSRLENNYDRIVGALQANLTGRTDIYILKDLASYHNMIGYPEFPEWATGSAWGRTAIYLASPNHAGSTSYKDMLINVIHEFTHITEAWKTRTTLPIWLNEGVATWFANQVPTRQYIRTLINGYGGLPQLSRFENGDTFGDDGGYQMAYTIVEFILQNYGSDKLATFLEQVSYPVLGLTGKTAFQEGWHTFLNNYYVNTPPPTTYLGTIKRLAGNWLVGYAPHAGIDTDGNTIIYYVTLTSGNTSHTYCDSLHTGTFVIPRSDLGPDQTYTVAVKSFDGMAYTLTPTTKTFSTANVPPQPFAFTHPLDGSTLARNTGEPFQITWSPAMEFDSEGDTVNDRIRILGKDFSKEWTVPGKAGLIEVDSADLLPGTPYTLIGLRTDGTDTVSCDTISFITAGTNGISNESAADNFRVYPLPFRTRLNIDIRLDGPGSGILEIRSVTGAIVWSDKYENRLSVRADADLSSLPAGLYFLAVIRSEGVRSGNLRTVKIIKE